MPCRWIVAAVKMLTSFIEASNVHHSFARATIAIWLSIGATMAADLSLAVPGRLAVVIYYRIIERFVRDKTTYRPKVISSLTNRADFA